MLDFSKRSFEVELLDNPEKYSNAVMAETYQEINFINKYLLGDYFILQDVWKLAKHIDRKQVTILDLGCGNGDLLIKLQAHLRTKNITMIGVGFDPYLSLTGGRSLPDNSIYLYDDWGLLVRSHHIDISVTSLTLHHLYGDELKQALDRLIETPNCGFVISDLMRNKLAYRIIKVLTQIFSKSELVKNDAPLSVRRAFSRLDMEDMRQRASLVATCELRSTISFRWLLTGKKATCV